MAPEAVSPLRILKSTSTSPSKMSRPLAEISPMGVRRNSPSTFQHPKVAAYNGDSSPFDPSPVSNSTLQFWRGKDNASPTRFGNSENVPISDSKPSARRASIEKLQKVSRVKNSNMFQRESVNLQDQDTSLLERSINTGRPISLSTQSNPVSPPKGHRRSESNRQVPLSPTKPSPGKIPTAALPNGSPTKSSMSSNSRYGLTNTFNPDEGTWSEDEDTYGRAMTPRTAARQAKTVSFDQGPPQINEYESITPDPSSVASGSREGSYEEDSFDMDAEMDRDSSLERDDSFDDSLEDTEKTPVVLPEDWKFMNPEVANTELAQTFDDPFQTKLAGRYNSPVPERLLAKQNQQTLQRSDSTNSDGEKRPLPPLPESRPGSNSYERTASKEHKKSLSNSMTPPPLPSAPRPASMSKADILAMRGSDMPLDERLRLLELDEQAKEMSRRQQDDDDDDDLTVTGDVDPHTDDSKNHIKVKSADGPPRISRESILRSMHDIDNQSSSPITSPARENEYIDYANLDPDEPIQSREPSSNYEDDDVPHAIKQEEMLSENGVIDMYALPESRLGRDIASPQIDDYAFESSVIHHDVNEEDDDFDEEVVQAGDEDDDTVKIHRPTVLGDVAYDLPKSSAPDNKRISLPEFQGFGEDQSFQSELRSFMSQSPNNGQDSLSKSVSSSEALSLKAPKTASCPEPPESWHSLATPKVQEPLTPSMQSPNVDDIEFGVKTPESVIHHFVDYESDSATSSIAEPVATVKASGSKLKIRRSHTVAELEAIAAEAEYTTDEAPPAMPIEFSSQQGNESTSDSTGSPHPRAIERDLSLNKRDSEIILDVPFEGTSKGLALGLDMEFDRLLEGQKKGYLMRQNTKVVIANQRSASGEKSIDSASSDATTIGAVGHRKPSGPMVVVEPWNGKMRRHSTRRSIIVPERGIHSGAVPPLPGFKTNAIEALDSLAENELSFANDPDGDSERGRLFVKVLGVKDLEMPLPTHEKSFFQLTLDNGLHCVTTAWLELGKCAPIGQEFELTVFDELDFSLTLQTKLERPRSQASQTSQNSIFESGVKVKSKNSALSRLLSSPKKRREAEKKQQEEEAQEVQRKQREREAFLARQPATAWDLLHGIVGPDGSFARSIVSLDDHERHAFGKPYIVDVPCFNSWATEDSATSRSKHGGVQRKPPYKIGNLELQLLYIPKPKGVKDEEMPQSMSACIKQLKEAEINVTRQWEGHLSQQGGDCPYWRRRFFKLNGSSMTAYHESTRQRRANINLAKATKLIDDKSSLTQPNASPSKKGRRKSAFADDEEGYMFVEEGFRIKFANGEVIDFYADSRQDKEGWMSVLVDAVGKESAPERPTWTAAVLARHKLEGRTSDDGQQAKTNAAITKSAIEMSSKSAPTSPVKSAKPTTISTAKDKPLPAPASSRRQVERSSMISPTKTIPAQRPASPTKARPASPSKARPSSPSKVAAFLRPSSPTKAATSSMSPAKGTSPIKRLEKERPSGSSNNKRQGVRSMIF